MYELKPVVSPVFDTAQNIEIGCFFQPLLNMTQVKHRSVCNCLNHSSGISAHIVFRFPIQLFRLIVSIIHIGWMQR